LTIDLDSTICETYGLPKQGGWRFTHQSGVRGYHALLATAAGWGDVIHCRLRGGNANSGRGAASFVNETLLRARGTGAQGPLLLRADSGFYSQKVVNACVRRGVRLSTVRLNKKLWKAIDSIPEINDTQTVRLDLPTASERKQRRGLARRRAGRSAISTPIGNPLDTRSEVASQRNEGVRPSGHRRRRSARDGTPRG
jgi:Transposase DDE domain group 1